VGSRTTRIFEGRFRIEWGPRVALPMFQPFGVMRHQETGANAGSLFCSRSCPVSVPDRQPERLMHCAVTAKWDRDVSVQKGGLVDFGPGPPLRLDGRARRRPTCAPRRTCESTSSRPIPCVSRGFDDVRPGKLLRGPSTPVKSVPCRSPFRSREELRSTFRERRTAIEHQA